MRGPEVTLVKEVFHQRLASVGGRLVVHVPGRAAKICADGLARGAEALRPFVAELVVSVLDGLWIERSHAVATNVILRDSVRIVEEPVGGTARGAVQLLCLHGSGGEQLRQSGLHFVLVLVHQNRFLANTFSVLFCADIVTEFVTTMSILGTEASLAAVKGLRRNILIRFFVTLRHVDYFCKVSVLCVNRVHLHREGRERLTKNDRLTK